jgi:taurine transport system substrate-binding protein
LGILALEFTKMRRIKMKRRLWILVFLGILTLVFSQAAICEDKPKVVRIGYLSLVNAQLLTKYLKYHEKELGVPIEWYKFNSGRDVNTAMASGSLDFGNVGLPPATIGIAGGLKYWGILNANVLGAVESLVARPGINSVKDLEGKTVTAPFGSTTHYLLLRALEEAGVDLKKVKLLDMAPSEALASYMRGDIDAAYIWEPSLGKVVEQGGKIILTSAEMGARGAVTWDIITVQPEFAQKYPELVKKFIKSELRAIDYWFRLPEESAKIISEELGGISVQDARRMMAGTELVDMSRQLGPNFLGNSQKRGISADDIVAVGKFLLQQGRIKDPVTKEAADSFIHPEFLEAVDAEIWK